MITAIVFIVLIFFLYKKKEEIIKFISLTYNLNEYKSIFAFWFVLVFFGFEVIDHVLIFLR